MADTRTEEGGPNQPRKTEGREMWVMWWGTSIPSAVPVCLQGNLSVNLLRKSAPPGNLLSIYKFEFSSYIYIFFFSLQNLPPIFFPDCSANVAWISHMRKMLLLVKQILKRFSNWPTNHMYLLLGIRKILSRDVSSVWALIQHRFFCWHRITKLWNRANKKQLGGCFYFARHFN